MVEILIIFLLCIIIFLYNRLKDAIESTEVRLHNKIVDVEHKIDNFSYSRGDE